MNENILEELSIDQLVLLVSTMKTLTADLEALAALLEKAALESEDSQMLQAARIAADTILKIRTQLAGK